MRWKFVKTDGFPAEETECVILCEDEEKTVGILYDGGEWNEWLVMGEIERSVVAYIELPPIPRKSEAS